MARENKSAEEISAAIAALANGTHEVQEDGVQLAGPAVTALQQADEAGCNWTVMSVSNTHGHAAAIWHAVEEAKQRFNLG